MPIVNGDGSSSINKSSMGAIPVLPFSICKITPPPPHQGHPSKEANKLLLFFVLVDEWVIHGEICKEGWN
jgi:hypothetical protein